MTDQTEPALDRGSIAPAGSEFEIRPTVPEDRGWVRRVLRQYWASTEMLTRGRVIDAAELPGFVATRDGSEIGLITYQITDAGCEVVTHNSLAGSGGIGSCLLAAVRQEARNQGCRRVWCVTTNDNTPAMRFYQRRGFELVAVHREAVTKGRSLKPEIPDLGLDGIPIRHEVELEYIL